MTIGRRTVDGFEGLTLVGDDGIEATFVPSAGMIACSLRHGRTELLGQRRGLGAYVGEGSTMGIPLLYPWANRLSLDRFELDGRQVDLGAPGLRLKRDANGLAMHGLLTAYRGWRVEEHDPVGGALAASFDFGADAALAAAFPFPHVVRYEARLAGPTLAIALTIEPTAGVPVPVAFGFHPYLRIPRLPRTEWQLEAPVGTALSLDARGLPTGEREPTAIASGPLADSTFDDAFEAPPGGAPFALSGGGRRIEVAFESGFPFAQIYAPAGDSLIAIEPMTAPTDALASGDGLRRVAPGESFTAGFAITLAAER